MRIINLFIAIASVSFFCSCNTLKNTGSSSFGESDSPYVKEEPTVKKAPYSEKIVVKEEKVKVIDETEKDKELKFYVIIGSFKVLENARNYKIQLSDEGFRAVILENANGLYRVSVKSSNDENVARQEIGSIQSRYENHGDTWLLIRKY